MPSVQYGTEEGPALQARERLPGGASPDGWLPLQARCAYHESDVPRVRRRDPGDVGEEGAPGLRAEAGEAEAAMSGRLVAIWFKRSREARLAALASIAPVCGRWVVRIGGPVRGEFHDYATRQQAERAVHEHYNRALLARIKEDDAPGDGHNRATCHG